MRHLYGKREFFAATDTSKSDYLVLEVGSIDQTLLISKKLLIQSQIVDRLQ
jgi:hypothetical protein